MQNYELYIARHGKTEWNSMGLIQGRNNSPLLTESVDYIVSMATRFKGISIDRIISSPLERAVQTSEIYSLVLGVDYCVDDLLVECNHGVCEGYTLNDIRQRYPEFYKKREDDKWNVPWPSGESYSDLYDRASEFISKLDSGKKYLIIGHEMINKCILGRLLMFNPAEIMRIKQDNNVIFHVDGNNCSKMVF